MADAWIEKVRSLLEAPSPAVLTTYLLRRRLRRRHQDARVSRAAV